MESSIIADLKESYGLDCNQITPVTGGLLNLKWRVSTNRGDILVKQYSTVRFRKDQIDRIEYALYRQIILEKTGVSCPFIWQYKDRIIRWLGDNTAYMVMDFCSGNVEAPETITLSQMLGLGSACAVMHLAFSKLPVRSDECLPVFGGYTMELLTENINSRITNCPQDAHPDYRKALLSLEVVLKRLDASFFDKFPKGFAHEDMQAGNILFDADCVSAIVDFDRNCYSYIWHDIGRALLSFALEGNIMNTEKIRSFINGYSRHLPLSLSNIADALRLSWCIELIWWIQPEFFGDCTPIPIRFKNEMLWLTEHWLEIESIVFS